MHDEPVSLTELPLSPEQEQRTRMRRYALMMGIRVLCILACLITPGWWLLAPALGAVFLPYVAVVVANAATRGSGRRVERPTALTPARREDDR